MIFFNPPHKLGTEYDYPHLLDKDAELWQGYLGYPLTTKYTTADV